MTEDEFLTSLTLQLEEVMQECNSKVIAKICTRLNELGKLSYSDAVKLANMTRTQDLKEIERILADTSGRSEYEIEQAVEKACKYNDTIMERFYKARKIGVDMSTLNAIKKRAIKSMKDGILNLSDTTAFVIDGKPTSISKTYRKAVNSGIYGLQQGMVDYNTSIRSIVRKMAESGLRKVDYESGVHRRLDSAVRMNLLDGMRQMNMEYRQEQGEQFGADGVEISVHGMCAPDHLYLQGRQFTKKHFRQINETLERPIGTCNCYHSIFPIIMGISDTAYSKEELKAINDASKAEVTYTDKRGDVHTCTAYEATQLQRRQETTIRRLKDIQYAYEQAGDTVMAKEYAKKITKQRNYYKTMSAEVGLKPKMERTRIIKPKN
jgi:hypothetical protein